MSVFKMKTVKRDKGYFEYYYLIYEMPHFVELENDKEYPGIENPHLDILYMEEPTQINTKRQIDKDDIIFFCARRT